MFSTYRPVWRANCCCLCNDLLPRPSRPETWRPRHDDDDDDDGDDNDDFSDDDDDARLGLRLGSDTDDEDDDAGGDDGDAALLINGDQVFCLCFDCEDDLFKYDSSDASESNFNNVGIFGTVLAGECWSDDVTIAGL